MQNQKPDSEQDRLLDEIYDTLRLNHDSIREYLSTCEKLDLEPDSNRGASKRRGRKTTGRSYRPNGR